MSEETLEAGNLETQGDQTPTNEATLLAQKKHFREKAEKAEAEKEAIKLAAEKDKADLEAKLKEATDGNSANADSIRQDLELVKFSIANRDLDGDDIKELTDLAKGKGVSLADARTSPIFEAYLKDKKEKAEPSPDPMTARSYKFAPPKDPSQMTREEHKAWFDKRAGRG